MAYSNVPIFPQVIQNYGVQIANTDSTTKKLLCGAGTNGTKIEFIQASTTDTSNNTLQLYLYDGTTYHLVTTYTVTAGSGNSGTVAAFNILNSSQVPAFPYDSNGNKYIYLKNGWSLYVGVTVAVTSGKTLDIIAQGEDY